MRRTLRFCLFFTILLSTLVLISCQKQDSTQSVIEEIDSQLNGTWTCYDSDDVYSKWTFNNGQYVVDTYVDGEKLSNSTIGTYSIGTDSIHTLTQDQKNNVEGSIPYEYKNGILTLISANGGDVKKD